MTSFRRLVPRPLLSLLLWVVWLLLNNSLAAGHVLLGLVLAIAIPWLTYHFWNVQPDMHRPFLMVRFVLMLLLDILVANLQVARRVLGPKAQLQPIFFEFPLSIQGDFPITLLASTISLTPGTVSAQLSEDRRRLLIHALDVADPVAEVQRIQQRYERPLREIFQC